MVIATTVFFLLANLACAVCNFTWVVRHTAVWPVNAVVGVCNLLAAGWMVEILLNRVSA